MSGTLSTLLALIAFVLLAIWCLGHADEIQESVQSRSAAALADIGYAPGAVHADGRDVYLVGVVSSDQAAAEAVDLVASVPGVRKVVNELSIAQPAELALGLSGGVLRLAGRLGDEETLAGILESLRGAWDGEIVSDDVEVEPVSEALGYLQSLPALVKLLRDRLGEGKLAWGESATRVSAVLRSTSPRSQAPTDAARPASAMADSSRVARGSTVLCSLRLMSTARRTAVAAKTSDARTEWTAPMDTNLELDGRGARA